MCSFQISIFLHKSYLYANISLKFQILKQLKGKTVAWEQAQNMLQDIFTKKGKKQIPIILLVDEVYLKIQMFDCLLYLFFLA